MKDGFTWAPEVMKVGGKWLLYYTAAHRKRNVQCLGVAAADHPKGPFGDASAEPLVCQFDLGGTIDANPFRDADGKLYLYYKSDGNGSARRRSIWGQRLSDDGLSVVGRARRAGRGRPKWEWKLVEAPTMVLSPAGYQLFFSAAFFGWDYPKERLSRYATGYATCAGPLGPCKDAPENPHPPQLQRPGGGLPQRTRPPGIFQAGRPPLHRLPRLGGDQGLPQGRRQTLPLRRALVLEGRQAADRDEPERRRRG